MTPRNRIILIIAALALIVATGFTIHWFMNRETPESARDALMNQGIEVTEDNFISEIQARHNDNVHLFIITGMNATTHNQDGTTALIAATLTTNEPVVSMLLDTLPVLDPVTSQNIMNMQDKDGRTALIAAIEQNNAPLMRKLIEQNADVAIANHNLETPLLIAVKHKYNDLIVPLINADSKQHKTLVTVRARDISGDTPLVYAIQQQNSDLVKTLIAMKADTVSGDLSGTTPLMIAAEIGNESIGQLLIDAKAPTDVADIHGNTPLTIAIKHNQLGFVKFLVNHGADPDFHTRGALPLQLAIESSAFNYDLFKFLLGYSKKVDDITAPLLFGAVDQKNAELVKTLLDRGLDPKITNAAGETLLYHAIESGVEDTVLLLIDKGADITQTGIPGVTPLERAAVHNESKVVKKLLAMDISPDQKTAEGYTIAELAVYRGYPETLKALLDKGAKIEKDFGLIWAVRDGGGKSVPVLLADGANPNVANENGDPVLWLAASLGETEAVQALIEKHAFIDAQNKGQGMTPLSIASHTGQLAAVKLLLAGGARIEAKDNFGMTPLAHAAYMTKPTVMEYLISKGANLHATDNQGRSIADLAALAAPSAERDKVNSLLQRR